MTTTPELYVPLADADLRLVQLDETHRAALRAVAAADADIWVMYPYSMIGDHFDPAFNTMIGGPRKVYAVFLGERLVACTSWYDHDPVNQAVAIGGTFPAEKLPARSRQRRHSHDAVAGIDEPGWFELDDAAAKRQVGEHNVRNDLHFDRRR